MNNTYARYTQNISHCSLLQPYLILPLRNGSQLNGGRLDQVKVKVTLRLTVSQLVSLGVEPHLGLMTRYLVLFDSYGLFFCGASSLTRGRVSAVTSLISTLHRPHGKHRLYC
jgi:hypothetical protein